MAQRAVGYVLMSLCFKPFLAFFVGVFLADLWVNRRSAFSGFVGAVSLVAGVLLAYLSAFEFVGFHIGSAVSSGLILASVLALKPIRLFLETKPLLLLGKISFSIYVIHFPILASLGAQVHASTSNVTLACTATIGATVIGALLLERLVDRPGIAMSKRFGAWLARQNA
jgi:peptidoglycan/LPS O-acetylase OafA/YrhL